MGCRFPQADSPGELWELLLRNGDAVTPVPPQRYDAARHHDPVPGTWGRTVARHGGFLGDAFAFDPGFFGIAPTEARSMDPQQRLLLHVVWEALEDAGIVPADLAGTRTGVFIGQATAEYSETALPPDHQAGHDLTAGRIRAVTAGRVSHALDLRGPSLVLDTACSSSLVALHAARQSLLTGESEVAIAGGVNVILSVQDSISYSQAGMLSPGGRCRFADTGADGFVRSEGVGVVVLKPLSAALRDHDPVLALLLGTAVTNDGNASGLLLRPSVDGQAEMVRTACERAGVEPGRLDYVEAHGAGTPVGDAVELRALAAAVAPGRPADRPLAVGSVKSNIGHAEAAAGIAGLIKAVLVARHGVVPASLHLDRPSPLLGELPALRVPSANEPLRKAGPRALVGVSSFGLSGTNAHAVLAEYPAPRPRPAAAEPAADQPHLLVLSARTAGALRATAARCADHLQAGGRAVALHDICATAATRRQAHRHRLWAVGRTHDELAATLRSLAAGDPAPGGGTGDAGPSGRRRTVFVFPGQGSQWAGMGRALLAGSPAFRAALERCDEAVRAELGWSVVEALTSATAAFPTAVDQVQPALWAMEVALAAALRAAGVSPEVCLGHSMGEAAAAHVAGALSVRDAAAVICRRSRLMRRVAGAGAMLATDLSAADAARAAEHAGGVTVAAENSPRSTVLAGPRAALDRLAADLTARGVFCRLVRVDVASHSPAMDPLHGPLLTELARLEPAASTVGMLSTVRRAPVTGAELDAAYWAENLRAPVGFTDTVALAGRAADSVFVEVSPHPLLTSAIEDTLHAHGHGGAAVATLRRDHGTPEDLLRTVGAVFAAGGRVDWSRRFGPAVRPVGLPPYAWETTALRLPVRRAEAGGVVVRQYPLARPAATSAPGAAPLPPLAPLAAALRAAGEVFPGQDAVLEDVTLHDRAAAPAGDADLALRVELAPGGPAGAFAVTVTLTGPGLPDGDARCATATLRTAGERSRRFLPHAVDRHLERCGRYLSAAAFDVLAAAQGIEAGGADRAVEQVWTGPGRAVARMRGGSAAEPVFQEAGLHALAAAWSPGAGTRRYRCAGIASVRLYGELPDSYWSLASFTPGRGGRPATGQVLLVAPGGRLLAEFGGIALRRADERTGGTPEGAVRPEPAPGRVVQDAVPAGLIPAQRQADDAARPSGRKVLLTHAAAVLGLAAADIDLRTPLQAHGLDSFMATRLRYALRTECGIEVSTGHLLSPRLSVAGLIDLMENDGTTSTSGDIHPSTRDDSWTVV